MGSEWKMKALADCGTWFSGGTPNKSNKEFWSGDIPWISAKSLHDFFVCESEDRVTEAAIGNGTRLLPVNSIIFVVRGMSLKTEFRLGITTRPVSFNQDLKAIVPNDDIDVNFLVYAIKAQTHQIMSLVEEAGHGTGVLPTELIKSLRLKIPSRNTQKTIGAFFRSIDDKIELNRRMNETLESMARTLFKSWFVDFDPVIDNALAAGNPIPESLQARAETRLALGPARQPLPPNIQKLFPAAFQFDEEMGWIPDGWEVSEVGSEFRVTMGQSPPGHTYNQDANGTPFFQGSTDFGFRYPTKRVYCTAPKRMAEMDDTLVSVRAPVGDVNMASEACCVGRGVAAVRHKSTSRSFTYYSMIQLRERFKVYESEGTVFGSINQKGFNALPLLDCPANLISEFELHAGSVDEKIEANSEGIINLTKLRDTLLPNLLSGELRIPDAEKLLTDSL